MSRDVRFHVGITRRDYEKNFGDPNHIINYPFEFNVVKGCVISTHSFDEVISAEHMRKRLSRQGVPKEILHIYRRSENGIMVYLT